MHIDLNEKILKKNDELAGKLKDKFREHSVFVINLLASPGSGKTSTILALINALSKSYEIAVIEGDIASDVDSQKIKAHGSNAIQINTGGACHLESNMIQKAVELIDLDKTDIIIIENVGNLVCPTDFDLGENVRIMILSVPEGDDKPLKYPGIFQVSDCVLVNKIDTLPVFDFDVELFKSHVKKLNAVAPVFEISATKGDGIADVANWIEMKIN